MSEKNEIITKTALEDKVDTTAVLKLDDDILFPGESNASPKTSVGPGAYNIFIPSASAIGTATEYEQVRALCGELAAFDQFGSVSRVGVSGGIWNVTFGLNSGGNALTNEIVKPAFAALKPLLDGAEVLETGFVRDDLPYWKLMDGTKVARKGNFKKTA